MEKQYAFPKPKEMNNPNYFGLTKREYFAGMAMQAMTCFDLGQNDEVAKEIARRAVVQADELLKQLEK